MFTLDGYGWKMNNSVFLNNIADHSNGMVWTVLIFPEISYSSDLDSGVLVQF